LTARRPTRELMQMPATGATQALCHVVPDDVFSSATPYDEEVVAGLERLGTPLFTQLSWMKFQDLLALGDAQLAVAPTVFRKKPFGENVEGLSHFRDKSCAVEPAVQTGDFEDSTVCIVTSGATFILTDLSTMIYFRYGTPKRIRPRPSLGEGYGRVLATGLRSHIDGRLDPRDGHRSPEHVRHVRRQASALPRSPATLRGQQRSRVFKRIYETPSPFVAICDYLLSIADGTSADRARGCFYVNATNELALSDPAVAAAIRANSARCEAAFERILREAKGRGEVDRSLDERVAARFLLSTIRGLRVSAKANVEPEDLRAIASLALSSLKPR